jgi:hypothetical protein
MVKSAVCSHPPPRRLARRRGSDKERMLSYLSRASDNLTETQTSSDFLNWIANFLTACMPSLNSKNADNAIYPIEIEQGGGPLGCNGLNLGCLVMKKCKSFDVELCNEETPDQTLMKVNRGAVGAIVHWLVAVTLNYFYPT